MAVQQQNTKTVIVCLCVRAFHAGGRAGVQVWKTLHFLHDNLHLTIAVQPRDKTNKMTVR